MRIDQHPILGSTIELAITAMLNSYGIACKAYKLALLLHGLRINYVNSV